MDGRHLESGRRLYDRQAQGCTYCYGMEMAKRLQAMDVEKFKGLTRRSGRRTIWNGVVS